MTPRNVCLVIPPSPFLLDERVFMSLGVLRIAAVLERAGWYVEVLDLSGYKNYLEVVQDHLQHSRADVFGLTATTPQFPAAVQIAQIIRAHRPGERLILGGPHATLVNAARNAEMKRRSLGRAHRAFEQASEHFDVFVAGDGEEAIFLACEENAPALIDADGRQSPLFLSSERLEHLPWPARHLVDVQSYRYAIDGVPALSLISQLGCPFACGFCAGRSSPMLRHIRTRSAENIIKEMVHLYHAYGTRGFMFYDDELNVNRGMVDLMRRIADSQRELGVEWRLRGFIKAELFTDEQAAAMYEAGFRWILVGFESGSSRILENINKRATREENSACVEIACRHGIKVKALMSLGHPGESPKTVADTESWLLEARPADFDLAIITPYPGSPYYDEAVLSEDGSRWVYQCKNGDRLYQEEIDYAKEADYYKGNPDGGYVSHVSTDYLSASDLVKERDRLERSVRRELGIPFNPSAASLLYEHSMGQTVLPNRILRVANAKQ